MKRAFVYVLDSVGVGGADDAAQYGDEGADTIGSIAKYCASLPRGPLRLPNMVGLGLGRAAKIANGTIPIGLEGDSYGFFGAAQEISRGKDTPSGHLEIAGQPITFDWGHFPDTIPALPEKLTDAMIRQGNLSGLIANCHASGTQVLDDFGEEHIQTGKPIVYTSVDSVIQIAAHEKHFGLENLYDLCARTRTLANDYSVGRVIARPFVGEKSQNFTRTGNRRDYAVPPSGPTLLDRVIENGGKTHAVGKISDIFAHQGISNAIKAHGNEAMFDAALKVFDSAMDGDFTFVNFVDFDSEYGHRRDVLGYAAALEAFDLRLGQALAKLQPGDLLILTADHGNDPTWHGSDHTRERIPIIGTGPQFKSGSVGLRMTFSDIGATIGEHLGLKPALHGHSFYQEIIS